MTSEQKPKEAYKEYWIEGNEIAPFVYLASTKYFPDTPGCKIIHVIEYSAYEQLQQENAKLKEQLAEITRGGLVKIADLPFEVKISSSIYIGEPMMFLPPKDFSDLEKHIKEKGITIESAGE